LSFALLETPGNPIPPGARVLPLTTRDGATLRAAWWPATVRQPRGTVCLLQGRAEFIEKYAETIADLLARGFAVAAFDWRGQGFSERDVDNPRKGHVADFALFAHDLHAVRESLLGHLPEPHFALGHSMGGAIALLAAKEGRLPFERLVAVAPMVALCMVRRPRAAMRLAYALNLVGFGRAFVPGGGETSIATKPFPGNRLTADPARYARNAAAASAVGAAAIGDPTVGWLAAAFRLMGLFEDPAFPLSIRLPTLIVAAGSDPVCATPAIERFAARLKAGHAVVIPGARHEILMERDAVRAQFWAAFDAFVPGTRSPALAEAAERDAARAARRGDLPQVA
jgi:lysophospholipase